MAISVHMFSTLIHTLQTMCDEDRVYCLMFNEMSIRDSVHFIQKFVCIVGCEGLGSHSRTNNIANHALVFVHCSLHKKWKRLVAYYLIHGSTKGEMLDNVLMEVFDTCRNAGLWHLHYVLQELPILTSCFEIQQQIWTSAVTLCVDYIRLLAGRSRTSVLTYNPWAQ